LGAPYSIPLAGFVNQPPGYQQRVYIPPNTTVVARFVSCYFGGISVEDIVGFALTRELFGIGATVWAYNSGLYEASNPDWQGAEIRDVAWNPTDENILAWTLTNTTNGEINEVNCDASLMGFGFVGIPAVGTIVED
jgi:hypothetical protein